MAGAAEIRAGRAFVELFVKNNLDKGLNKASAQLKAWGSRVTGVGQSLMGMGAVAVGAGATIASAFIAPIKAASDLMETTSKFGSVFGDQAGEATAWMEGFTKAVGRGKEEAMAGMSAFMAFFRGMGMGEEEAANFSKKMTAMAVDFASFHNISDPEAMQRFISAFSGSSEVLDMFGVNIKQAALDMKLMELGFPSIAKGADETQKVLARMAIIEESLGRQGALGDAIKTAGSFSNQMKRLRGMLADMAAEIGNALLPVLTPLVAWGSKATKIFGEWVKANHGAIQAVASMAAGLIASGASFIAIGAVLSAAGTAMIGLGGAIAAAWGVVSATLAAVLNPVTLTVAAVGAAAVAWLRYSKSGQQAVAYVTGAVRSAVNSMLEYFEPFVTTITESWGAVVKAVKAGDLVSAGKVAAAAFNEVWARIRLNGLEVWEQVKVAALNAWDELRVETGGAVAFVSSLFGAWMREVKALWADIVGAFKEGWESFSSFGAKAMDTLSLDFQDLIDLAANFDSRLKVALVGLEVGKVATEQGPEAAKAAAEKAAQVAKITNDAFKANGLDFGQLLKEAGEARDSAIKGGRGELPELRAARAAASAGNISQAAADLAKAQQRLKAELAAANAERPAETDAKMPEIPIPKGMSPTEYRALEAKHLGKGREIPDGSPEDIEEKVQQVEAARKSFGTFSARELVMQGYDSSLPMKQLEEQRKMKEALIKKLDENTKEMQAITKAVKDNQMLILV